MKLEERQQILSNLFAECLEVSAAKGAAYAGSSDALANFKKTAARLNMTMFEVWAVFVDKHLSAIFNAISENPDNPVEKTESLHGRIIDAIVYLGILESMSIEVNKQQNEKLYREAPREALSKSPRFLDDIIMDDLAVLQIVDTENFIQKISETKDVSKDAARVAISVLLNNNLIEAQESLIKLTPSGKASLRARTDPWTPGQPQIVCPDCHFLKPGGCICEQKTEGLA